jgi:transposase
MQQELLPIFLPDATIINGTLCYQKNENTIHYFVGCEPLFYHHVDEKMEFRFITSAFIVAGKCKQVDIIRTFGVSKISVKRWAKVYREEGIEGFSKKRRNSKNGKQKRKGGVLNDEKLKQAQNLFDNGKTRTEVANEIGVLRDTLVKAIKADRVIETKKKK